jgi:hypothetical protein
VYGCANATGTSYQLGSAKIRNQTPCPDHFALAGPIVAYGLNRSGIDTGTTTVMVRQLLNNRVIHADAATARGVVEGYGRGSDRATELAAAAPLATSWIDGGVTRRATLC